MVMVRSVDDQTNRSPTGLLAQGTLEADADAFQPLLEAVTHTHVTRIHLYNASETTTADAWIAVDPEIVEAAPVVWVVQNEVVIGSDFIEAEDTGRLFSSLSRYRAAVFVGTEMDVTFTVRKGTDTNEAIFDIAIADSIIPLSVAVVAQDFGTRLRSGFTGIPAIQEISGGTFRNISTPAPTYNEAIDTFRVTLNAGVYEFYRNSTLIHSRTGLMSSYYLYFAFGFTVTPGLRGDRFENLSFSGASTISLEGALFHPEPVAEDVWIWEAPSLGATISLSPGSELAINTNVPVGYSVYGYGSER